MVPVGAIESRRGAAGEARGDHPEGDSHVLGHGCHRECRQGGRRGAPRRGREGPCLHARRAQGVPLGIPGREGGGRPRATGNDRAGAPGRAGGVPAAGRGGGRRRPCPELPRGGAGERRAPDRPPVEHQRGRADGPARPPSRRAGTAREGLRAPLGVRPTGHLHVEHLPVGPVDQGRARGLQPPRGRQDSAHRPARHRRRRRAGDGDRGAFGTGARGDRPRAPQHAGAGGDPRARPRRPAAARGRLCRRRQAADDRGRDAPVARGGPRRAHRAHPLGERRPEDRHRRARDRSGAGDLRGMGPRARAWTAS